MGIDLSKHIGWIATFDADKYIKINEDSENARKIAFKKIGRLRVGSFYPIAVAEDIKQQWKNLTGFEMQTAETIMSKRIEVQL